MALVRRVSNDVSHSSSFHEKDVLFKRLQSAGLLRLPVNIYSVAEFLGLEVITEVMDDEMSGFIEPRRHGWVIGVNAFHHENRQRFTIAHEIGHYVLHKPNSRIVDVTFARRVGKRDRMETEADNFAAELLMPESIMRGFISNGVLSLEELASKFGVSVLAVKYRVQELGYSLR